MDIPAYFERLLRLTRKGGGPVIIANSNGEEPLVVLTLSAYEGLTEHGGATSRIPVAESEVDYEDEEFDSKEVERQVGEVIPQHSIRPLGRLANTRPRRPMGGMREVGESKAEIRQKPQKIEQNRRPILRRPVERNEGGEERFYLESV